MVCHKWRINGKKKKETSFDHTTDSTSISQMQTSAQIKTPAQLQPSVFAEDSKPIPMPRAELKDILEVDDAIAYIPMPRKRKSRLLPRKGRPVPRRCHRVKCEISQKEIVGSIFCTMVLF